MSSNEPSPSPIEDAERLKILRLLRIDDLHLDESLQAIVQQVGRLYEIQCCIINLVYLDRQLSRSWFGPLPLRLARGGNTHDTSLCTYVVEASAPLVVHDLDDRNTWQEPFNWPTSVIDFYKGMGVRFYAGVPLLASNGRALGTLCLIDSTPREIGAAALESLQFFAAKAAAELELASQTEKSRKLQNELVKTSLYASSLSELMLGLQNLNDVAKIGETTTRVLVEAKGIGWAALLESASTGPATVVAGQAPPGLLMIDELAPPASGSRQAATGSFQYLTQGEAGTRIGVSQAMAILPLPLTPTAPGFVLAAGRSEDGHWLDSDHFFLDSAARLITLAIQRSSRVDDLERAAHTDELTGLGNRRAFELLSASPRQAEQRLLLFMGDLAGFKLLNDALGHPVGDLCLRRVAEALAKSVRPQDRGHVFRIGGDEFVIVLPAESADADRLRQRFETAVAGALQEFDGIRLHLDMGVAVVPDEAATLKEAVALADARMYERKRAGVSKALSDRERQIMMMIVGGKRMKEIALELGITETTAATHRARFMKKMNLRDNRDLFRYALRHGILE